LDTVIATAHWPSLLALRATCKELRYKIDTELGRYIVLGPIGALQYGMSVSATNGHQHPAFAPWSPEWNVGVEGEEEDDDDGMDTL
jgi:hypothetical protein